MIKNKSKLYLFGGIIMNENEFKNYYQILGIDKSLLDYVIYDKKKDGKYENKLRNEASKDKK